MIDLSRIYHTGMAVADIDAACASVGASPSATGACHAEGPCRRAEEKSSCGN